MRIMQILKQILVHKHKPPAERKIYGLSGAVFSGAHYYVNIDGFIVCRVGGGAIDIKDKTRMAKCKQNLSES